MPGDSTAMTHLIILLLLVPFASSAQTLKGELGQAVLGCKCKGKQETHGHCSYHLHSGFGGDSDKPWCRTKYGCGESSIRGSWVYCDERGVEKRRAADGKLYHTKDFQKFYSSDGAGKWSGAAPYVEKRMADNNIAYDVYEFHAFYIDTLGEQGWITKWESASPETRKADDGKWYAWEQFVEYYGDTKTWQKWEAAKPEKAEL